MRDRFQMLLVVLVLLGVGALGASFWLEWRGIRMGDVGDRLPGFAATLAGPEEEAETPLRVEVLNGSGERGAARAVAMRLRDAGLDVVYFGNARSFDHEVTSVVNRSGLPGAARRVADVLGADSVATDVAQELYLDATIILGRDWKELSSR